MTGQMTHDWEQWYSDLGHGMLRTYAHCTRCGQNSVTFDPGTELAHIIRQINHIYSRLPGYGIQECALHQVRQIHES